MQTAVGDEPSISWRLGLRLVILSLTGGVRAEEEAVGVVGFGGLARVEEGDEWRVPGERATTHDSLSGNHWQVRLGQSSACVITTSYRYGAFFFL